MRAVRAETFELVLLAAERAHQLESGAEPLIATDDEPATMIALREIGTGRIEVGRLRESLIGRFSRLDPNLLIIDEPSFQWLEPSSRPEGSLHGPSGGTAPAWVH